MMRRWGVAVGIALLAAALPSTAKEPTFTPPPGWLEAGSDELVECPEGMTAQLTSREYRQFAQRHQIWPQEEIVDADWKAGRVLRRPELRYPSGVKGLPDPIRTRVDVLVGPEGKVLDAIVTCTNAPSMNAALLGTVPSFKFRNTRHKGRDLVSVFPISFELEK